LIYYFVICPYLLTVCERNMLQTAFWNFAEIYDLDAFGNIDELNRFWGQRSKVKVTVRLNMVK